MGLLVAGHVGNKILSFEFFQEDIENIKNQTHISRTSFLDFFLLYFAIVLVFKIKKRSKNVAMTFSSFHLLVHVLNECKDLEYLLHFIKRAPLVRQNYKLLSYGKEFLYRLKASGPLCLVSHPTKLVLIVLIKQVKSFGTTWRTECVFAKWL